MNFGKILKEKRILRGFSQQELANRIDVSKRTINYWESGQKKMSLENADKAFRALETTITIGK